MPKKQTTRAPAELPKMVQQHARWMLALARLVQLDRSDADAPTTDTAVAGALKKAKARRPVQAIPRAVIDAAMDRSPLTTNVFTEHIWNEWFAAKKESPISSIYEARAFYGLDSPNNVVQRFERMILDGAGSDRAPRTARSDYERAIDQWGDYAFELVRANGGIQKFFYEIESLDEVTDIYPLQSVNRTQWKPRQQASLGTSFVRRILRLLADEYVQIIVAPAAVLWPLWFMSHDTMDVIRATGDERVLGPKVTDETIPYIDLVTKVGEMAGYPYPFGAADEALAPHAKKENAVSAFEHSAPWSTEAMTIVADTFSTRRWSPPVLLAGRGDQWSIHDQSNRANPIVPIAVVSEASPIFASMYVRSKKFADVKKRVDLKTLRTAYEPKTWGERLVRRVEMQNAQSFQRSDFVEIRNRSDFDLVLSYFPVDILLQSSAAEFKRMSAAQLATYVGRSAEDLEYILPSAVLAAGRLIGEQPKMRTLMINLVRVLHRAVELVQHLRPRGDIAASFQSLRRSQQESERVQEALAIRRLCRERAEGSRIESPLLHSDSVPSWMRSIGRRMLEALMPQEGPARTDAIRAMDAWGWAQLLEYVSTTSVYVSVELF